MNNRFQTLFIVAIITLCSCGEQRKTEDTAQNTQQSPSNKLLSQNKDSSKAALEVDIDSIGHEEETAPADSLITYEEEATDVNQNTPEEVEQKKEVSPEEQLRESVDEQPEEDDIQEEVEQESPMHSHQEWDMLLQKHVTPDGKVNYSSLKKEKGTIESYIARLANNGPKTEWSHNVRLAFWINLYNAVTVNLILDHYPLKSIMDINNGKAWDLKLVTVEDKALSLNDIEHNIIRKRFNEPRIHFAVNCAAKSCPKLLNSAFLPEKLDQQLSFQANYFVNNTSKNNISSDQLELSKIFDWYGSDFGDVNVYIKKFIPTLNTDLKPSFMVYDWALNE